MPLAPHGLLPRCWPVPPWSPCLAVASRAPAAAWCLEKSWFGYAETHCRHQHKVILESRAPAKSRGRREGPKDHQSWGGTGVTMTKDSWAGVSLLCGCLKEEGFLFLLQRQPLVPSATLGCSPGLFRTSALSGGWSGWSDWSPIAPTVAPAALGQLPDPPPGSDCIPVPGCRRASGAPGGILDVESILIAVSVALLQRAQEQLWSKSRIWINEE